MSFMTAWRRRDRRLAAKYPAGGAVLTAVCLIALRLLLKSDGPAGAVARVIGFTLLAAAGLLFLALVLREQRGVPATRRKMDRYLDERDRIRREEAGPPA